MTRTALKFANMASPARLKLAEAIDHRNVNEERMRAAVDDGDKSVFRRKLSDIDATIRLAVIETLIEEAHSSVERFDAAANALAAQVGATIRLLDDFATVTRASGLGHDKLQHVYSAQTALNQRVDQIGKRLFADMNTAAAEAAVEKIIGSTGRASPLADLAEALVSNPTVALEA